MTPKEAAETIKVAIAEVEWEYPLDYAVALEMAVDLLEKKANGRLVELPCKMGDTAWAIRNCAGIRHPREGEISEMYFSKDMSLAVALKGVARGEFGKSVFLTREEAVEALRREEHGKR